MPQDTSKTSLANLPNSGTSLRQSTPASKKNLNNGKGANMSGPSPSNSRAEIRPLPDGVETQCDRCNRMVLPCHDTHPSLGTHLTALCLFIVGLPFCIVLPYCIDCFGKPVKRCPNCGNYLQGP